MKRLQSNQWRTGMFLAGLLALVLSVSRISGTPLSSTAAPALPDPGAPGQVFVFPTVSWSASSTPVTDDSLTPHGDFDSGGGEGKPSPSPPHAKATPTLPPPVPTVNLPSPVPTRPPWLPAP